MPGQTKAGANRTSWQISSRVDCIRVGQALTNQAKRGSSWPVSASTAPDSAPPNFESVESNRHKLLQGKLIKVLSRGAGIESSIAQLQSENHRISEGFRILGDSVRLKNTAFRRSACRNARRFLEVGIEHL